MKVVRTFSSVEDAHLARMNLANEGIDADVLDEATGATAPPLAFAGGVRLAVSDEDANRAREVLGLPPVAETPPSKGVPLRVFVIVGIAFLILLIHAIRNHESRPDANQTAEYDRNGDGRADERLDFEDDLMVRAWSDDNFDGRWDSRTDYADDVPSRTETDLDFDGDFDSIMEYRHGVPNLSLVRDGGSGPVLVRSEFQDGILLRTWEDSDGDGQFDLLVEYDSFGRESRRKKPE